MELFETRECGQDANETGLLADRKADLDAIDGSVLAGRIHDWRTSNVYFRNAVYSSLRGGQMKVCYTDTFIQLLFLKHGSGLSTRFTAGGTELYLEPGQFTLFRHPTHQKRFVSFPECTEQEVCVINIRETFFRSIPLAIGTFGAPLDRQSFLGPFPISPSLHKCLEDLKTLTDFRSAFRGGLLDVKTQEIVLFAQEAYRKFPEHRESIPDSKIAGQMYRVAALLEKHPEQNHTLKALSQYSASNITYLKLNFKKLYGKTVFEYLNWVRMKMAKALLTAGELPICDIAQRCGYRHTTHFTAAYRKFYGHPPSAHRANLKE